MSEELFSGIIISTTETVNGSAKLKTPIRLLKELTDAFARLEEGDTRRTDILSAVDGET